MNLDEAFELLSSATRSELRDHAFGDMEVTWMKDGIVIAEGYFGNSTDSVTIGDGPTASFTSVAARSLMNAGTRGRVGRNDETGPDEFVMGEVMTGLSTGDVFHELTGKYLDEK